MVYLPLARKYRPQCFADLVGQDTVVKALANSIKIGREPHAVIFSGVRGIGKTTTARLYAKALNCVHGPTAEPCGVCEDCKHIEEGRHEDVLEIDGASHTGVDDIRLLRETVDYLPQRSKFRVYIIDEVHMLSVNAFNALLKTLEEPASHVVFVFATTEFHKIPQTIVSRCQCFFLQKFSLPQIVNRLEQILNKEGIPFETKALHLVARQGHGSMRDALTFLDQVIALGDGAVTMAALKDVVVEVSVYDYMALLQYMFNRDIHGCRDALLKLEAWAVEPGQHAEQLALICRHGMILRELGTKALDVEYLGLDEQEKEVLYTLATQAPLLDLNRLFRIFVQCRKDLDGSDLDFYVFENYVMEWCLDPGLPVLDQEQMEVVTALQGSEPDKSPTSRNNRVGVEHGGNSHKKQNRTKRLLEQIRQRSGEDDAISHPVSRLVQNTKDVAHSSAANGEKPLQINQQQNEQEIQFPNSWEDLVAFWRKIKPLQARVLEEAYIVHFDPKLIHLAVKPNTMAGARLLEKQSQEKVLTFLRENFNFSGRFQVSLTTDLQQLQIDQQETLLAKKQRVKSEKQQERQKELCEHPVTREAMKLFNVDIDHVEFFKS